MDRQDVIAAVALKALDREMRLRGIIDQPAVEYYCQSGLSGVAKSVAMLCVLAWCLYDTRIPFWGAVSLVLAWVALEESRRQASRFNARVQLMDIRNLQAPHADSATFSDRKLADG